MMKTCLFFLILLFFPFFSGAQQHAVTETGEEVILYEDGTWLYKSEQGSPHNEISVNPQKFEKSEDATFLLKSTKVDIGVWLNPKKWAFKKAVNNKDAEYELQLKDEDLYGMIIAEKIEIPLETLRGIALDNARSVASDIYVAQQEYRNVNDQRVLFMQMNGTMQGVKITHYGYYFSNPGGTVQFLTYTAQNLMNGYQKECEELLNGLVVTE